MHYLFVRYLFKHSLLRKRNFIKILAVYNIIKHCKTLFKIIYTLDTVIYIPYGY